MGLMAALAVVAMTASAASAKGLELYEEGVPVAAGAEVGLALEFGGCDWFSYNGEEREEHHTVWDFGGNIAVNGARTDVMTIEPAKVSCIPFPDQLYPPSIGGKVQEIQMSSAGRATIYASLQYSSGGADSQDKGCLWEFNKLSGTFPIPGSAYIEGNAAGKKNKSDSGRPCSSRKYVHFVAEVHGLNAKLLETQRVG
jgi:hypothetical protein